MTIAEDFTPPENWVPGQTVDKNVGVVNTGNVDAFVRAWLEGEMRLISRSTSQMSSEEIGTFIRNMTTGVGDNPAPSQTLTEVEDQKLKDLGLTYSYTAGDGDNVKTYYLKELNAVDQIQNPDTSSTTDTYTEVMAIQSGGELAYAPENAEYEFTANQSMSITNSKGKIQNIVKGTKYTVTINSGDGPVGDATVEPANIVVSNDTNETGTIKLSSFGAFRTIDSNTFKPHTSGLYIFRRNVALNDNEDKYQFSGYYYDSDLEKYFALDTKATDESDYVLDPTIVNCAIGTDGSYSVTPNGVMLFSATDEKLKNEDLKWTLAGSKWVVTNGDAGKVKINVTVANVGTNAEQWTYKSAAGKTTTYYYNNDLEEGATTAKLVDSVELDSSVTKEDFIAFDFDLNVKMESIQVTVAENGDEGVATVNPWSAGASNVGAKAEATVTNGEITKIQWNDATA